jgi:hypothetical protein
MMEPAAVRTQPARLNPPYVASDAGRRKTPEPIMFPITIATADHKPSTRVGLLATVLDMGAAGSRIL